MDKAFKKLQLPGICISLVILLFASCRKPDPVLPEGPSTINVEVTVPTLIYSNIKEVYLDASRTISLNSRRAIFFNWSCTSFPATAGLPVIIDSNKPAARLENPGIGQYIFKLTVKDNLGNMAESRYTLDVLEDTLAGKKPIAKAGPDQQINAPNNTVILDASETFSFNPRGRPLFFKWTIIQQPSTSNEVRITQNNIPVTPINKLLEGNYKIQLEVKNDVGLTAFDTMEINVLPDTLKGTTRVYENVSWERITDDGFGGEYICIVFYQPELFFNRNEGNMQIKVWDAIKKEWSDPNEFDWYINNEVGLFIYYPYLDDEEAYFKMEGVKTRVEIKFL